MKKNFFDRLSDSYENFHLKESEINMGNDTVYISPKLKLMLGWSLFILCCILAYVVIGRPLGQSNAIGEKEKEAVLNDEVDVDEEHDTMIPYEKDADKELNTFIESYFNAITACDNVALQDMVTDPSVYSDNESLKKKAEFITGYSNITVYSKVGLDEGSYIAFVVANLTITGVNSSPYDIITLYIVNGARGFMINNGSLSEDAEAYIEKVKGDKDIQEIYKSVEEKNTELREQDASLQEFYNMLSGENTQGSSEEDLSSEDTEAGEAGDNEEASGETDDAGEDTGDTATEPPSEE